MLGQKKLHKNPLVKYFVNYYTFLWYVNKKNKNL